MSMFNKEVAIQAILYILSKLKGQCDIHKVCKILYFADQKHLSKYSRSITGDNYIKMQYGPVPSKIDDIFKAVRGDSFFSDTQSSEELKGYFVFQNRYLIKQLKEVDLDYLSLTDKECLDSSIALCKDKNFGELTEFSHGLAWQNTQQDRQIAV